MICPACEANSGDSWIQCTRRCPMPMSPHFSPEAKLIKYHVEVMIENCRENGYWEETKKQSMSMLAEELQNENTVLADKLHQDVVWALKVIKQEGMLWGPS